MRWKNGSFELNLDSFKLEKNSKMFFWKLFTSRCQTEEIWSCAVYITIVYGSSCFLSSGVSTGITDSQHVSGYFRQKSRPDSVPFPAYL